MARIFRFLNLLILIMAASSVMAKDLLPKPKNSRDRFLVDKANVLTIDQEDYLLNKLRAYYDSTSTEFVVVIDNSLEGEDIFDYSFRLAEQWGIGQKGKDNGLLLYIAMDDRKMFIQVGYGLEGVITDARAKRVVEQHIKPYFKRSAYGQGIDDGINALIAMASGEYRNDTKRPSEGIPVWVIIVIALILLTLFLSGGSGGSTYGPSRHRGGGMWIGGSSGGGSFGGGGGFGGGFGGGSFGGGGAGGSW